jgi:hypothetical protein
MRYLNWVITYCRKASTAEKPMNWWGHHFFSMFPIKKSLQLPGKQSKPLKYKINISMVMLSLSHHGKQLSFPMLNSTLFERCKRGIDGKGRESRERE